VETQEGHIFKCPRCNLEMDRHKVTSINIRRRYLECKRRKKRKTRMQGFPHSYEPEGGAVGRGHPERAEPSDMDLDERGPEGYEAKGRGFGIKPYRAQ